MGPARAKAARKLNCVGLHACVLASCSVCGLGGHNTFLCLCACVDLCLSGGRVCLCTPSLWGPKYAFGQQVPQRGTLKSTHEFWEVYSSKCHCKVWWGQPPGQRVK